MDEGPRICPGCRQWAHFHGSGPDCEETENDFDQAAQRSRLTALESEVGWLRKALAQQYRAAAAGCCDNCGLSAIHLSNDEIAQVMCDAMAAMSTTDEDQKEGE